MFRHAHAKEEDSKLQRTKPTTKRARKGGRERRERLHWGMQRYGMHSPRLLQHIIINYDTLWCSFCDAKQTHSKCCCCKGDCHTGSYCYGHAKCLSSKLRRNTPRNFIPAFYHSIIVPPGSAVKCARKWNAAAVEAAFGTSSSSPYTCTIPPHPPSAQPAPCLRTLLPGLLFIILLFLLLLPLVTIPTTHKVAGY